ncbi:regulatory protein RecX [Herbidospora galbida]|uniref:Regulatory protein RecX n=1 Tax=Herbidospora galbida TaxID=2575442 RepID=A0A4U3MM26_9ACTN|nr:regulatory protein RecX [Herbidospora galbida]
MSSDGDEQVDRSSWGDRRGRLRRSPGEETPAEDGPPDEGPQSGDPESGPSGNGPRHADWFPGGGRDGAAGSPDSRAAEGDRPNPLDWGGLPDEEPGRGRRARRSKTGRAGRRASRRDDPTVSDPDVGAPAEGEGIFGTGGRSGGYGASGDGGPGDGGSGGRSKRRGSFSEEHSGDPEARARGICLRLLTLAPRTRAQLAEALLKREIPSEVAERVLERFSEVGLIDDQAFAAMWVSSRHHGRGLARRALAQELRHRGVEEEMVKEAVEQLDPDEEVETARRLVARKLGSTRGADPRARTRKLVGMLARKGYPAGLAFRIVREALEAEGEETSEEAGGDYLDSP